MSKLIFFDVCGTLTLETSIWQYLLERTGKWKGYGDRNLELFLSGAIDYTTFCHLDAELFTGMMYADLKAIAYEVPKYKGQERLFGRLSEEGYTICLLSTGLKLLTDYFCERYDVSHCIVNDLAHDGGTCIGKALINVADHEKGAVARRLIDELKPTRVAAVGDSGGDLPVFKEADISIAINAKNPVVRGAATRRFDGHDLSDLLPLILDPRSGSLP
jgi:phosphoserine phosphatase